MPEKYENGVKIFLSGSFSVRDYAPCLTDGDFRIPSLFSVTMNVFQVMQEPVKSLRTSIYLIERHGMRLLLIEEDMQRAGAIMRDLGLAHYLVDMTQDRTDGLRMARDRSYALVLLSLNGALSDMEELCERLRAYWDGIPILLLTTSDHPSVRAQVLDMGVDDCLARPYDPQELTARVRALLRRDRRHRARVIRVADLVIDTAARRVSRGGLEIALSVREYELLEALAAHEGYVLTRAAIRERVWMCDATGSNTVEAYIRLLRRKVDASYPEKLIQTIYGVGYSLRRPIGEYK